MNLLYSTGWSISWMMKEMTYSCMSIHEVRKDFLQV